MSTQPTHACAEKVWDGPYKMTCGYMIVNGRCVRHGEGCETYEIKQENEEPKP